MTNDTMALRELLQKGSDTTLLREMIGFAAQRLMELETEPLCGAAHGERSADRLNQRNGYRERDWETRAGTVELRIPKLRKPPARALFLRRPESHAHARYHFGPGRLIDTHLCATTLPRIDGDILACGSERVRILSLDAPEMHGQCPEEIWAAMPPEKCSPPSSRRESAWSLTVEIDTAGRSPLSGIGRNVMSLKS